MESRKSQWETDGCPSGLRTWRLWRSQVADRQYQDFVSQSIRSPQSRSGIDAGRGTQGTTKILAYLDSALQSKQEAFDAIKDKYTLEKDAEYQQVGNYIWPTQAIEKNLHRSFLRFQVNEQGIMSMTSIYCGASNIHHVGVKVTTPDGSFAETPTSKDSYETTDMNEKIESRLQTGRRR